jgi:hypothetical protein
MAYWFSGFFAKPAVSRPDELPEGAIWREIGAPFCGVGVRLDSLQGETPNPKKVVALTEQPGIARAVDWVYLTYVCWAGRIDFIYGLGARGRWYFGPIEESDVDFTKDVYLELMGEFGVEPVDAMRFPPFDRGFWGEA